MARNVDERSFSFDSTNLLHVLLKRRNLENFIEPLKQIVGVTTVDHLESTRPSSVSATRIAKRIGLDPDAESDRFTKLLENIQLHFSAKKVIDHFKLV